MKKAEIKGFRGSAVYYSRALEALFLFIRLSLAGSVVFGTYPSKTTTGGIIKKCGKIKRFNQAKKFTFDLVFSIYILNSMW